MHTERTQKHHGRVCPILHLKVVFEQNLYWNFFQIWTGVNKANNKTKAFEKYAHFHFNFEQVFYCLFHSAPTAVMDNEVCNQLGVTKYMWISIHPFPCGQL